MFYQFFFALVALALCIQPLIDMEMTVLQASVTTWLLFITFFDYGISIYVYGLKGFLKYKKLEVFDFFCSLSTLIFLGLYVTGILTGLGPLNIITVLKGIRFMGFILKLYPYNVLTQIIINLVPFISEVFIVIFIVFYIFTIVGIFIWGGKVTLETPNDNPWPEFYPSNYNFLNFNDFTGGFLTLFAVLIVNNWILVVSVFTDFIGYNVQWRFFFALFYLIGNLLSLYVLIGLVIDVAVTNLAEDIDSRKNGKTIQKKEDDTTPLFGEKSQLEKFKMEKQFHEAVEKMQKRLDQVSPEERIRRLTSKNRMTAFKKPQE